jgi:hypothetical protein
MILVEHRVGRLLETRVVSPISTQEIEGGAAVRLKLIDDILQIAPRYVSCVDVRHTRILSAVHAQNLISILRANNPNLERAAFLLSPKTLSLQVLRILHESQNLSRRHFSNIDELCLWLGELLTPAEMIRLREFIKEGQA